MTETPEPQFDSKAVRENLQSRLAELQNLAASTRDDRAPVELDQTSVGRLSRMDALQVQAMDLEKARRRETEIQRLHSALKRLDAGDYGYCIVCDD
ncbi:MAG: TraR/DksA family transcriptional regulator, partial [Rhodospirillales bacterium]